mmetsp:Transcript_1514/g.3191  ORF Transcript_1514/g.3191 Transcript_1514/m.3191 type:complete len:223 (+) Transcript_1514:1634-2302(+)
MPTLKSSKVEVVTGSVEIAGAEEGLITAGAWLQPEQPPEHPPDPFLAFSSSSLIFSVRVLEGESSSPSASLKSIMERDSLVLPKSSTAGVPSLPPSRVLWEATLSPLLFRSAAAGASPTRTSSRTSSSSSSGSSLESDSESEASSFSTFLGPATSAAELLEDDREPKAALEAVAGASSSFVSDLPVSQLVLASRRSSMSVTAIFVSGQKMDKSRAGDGRISW